MKRRLSHQGRSIEQEDTRRERSTSAEPGCGSEVHRDQLHGRFKTAYPPGGSYSTPLKARCVLRTMSHHAIANGTQWVPVRVVPYLLTSLTEEYSMYRGRPQWYFRVS
jgi:hypothetical protein